MKKAEKDIRLFILNVADRNLGSQAALARKAGKRRNQVSEYLSGKRDINLNTFLNYMLALNCNIRLFSPHTGLSLDIDRDDINQEIID